MNRFAHADLMHACAAKEPTRRKSPSITTRKPANAGFPLVALGSLAAQGSIVHSQWALSNKVGDADPINEQLMEGHSCQAQSNESDTLCCHRPECAHFHRGV